MAVATQATPAPVVAREFNGTGHANSLHDNITLHRPERILSNGLAFHDQDQRFWWDVIAPTIQDLLIKSQYNITHQYQYLILIYRYILPVLGPRPSPGAKPHWNSFMTDDFSPVETSVNFHGSKATVRLGFEPVGNLAGTDKDPFNRIAVEEFLRSMEDFSDVTNLDWYRHFAKDLLVASENAATISKKLPSNEHMSQNLFAFDFSDGKAALKTYFFPILKSLETGISEGRLICDSILKLDTKEYPVAPALALVEAYVASRENLRVETLSFDCNEPRDSRIKVYLRTPYTSFRHVSDIYTLGGRLKDATTVAGVEILRELWPLLLDVPADYANDDPLPPNDHRTAGFGFNFEIRPGKTYPEPKVYIPVKHYGKTDIAVAEGLATYFRRQGWNDLANSYPKDLRLRFPHHPLDMDTGTQTYVSYSYKNKGPYMTVYFSPKVYSTMA